MNIRKIRKFFKNLLLKLNLIYTKPTNISELLDLIKKLHPIKTNHNLIRVGGDYDGGYLIPNDLIGIDCLFSPGVSYVANFEKEMIEKINELKCFLADYSVNAPPFNHPNFNFEKKFLGAINNSIFFTLEEWIKKKSRSKNDYILQMDIEGFEYEVLISTKNEILNKFRIIVIEFHNLHKLAEESSFVFFKTAFLKILQTHDVVHIHPNNTVNHLCINYKGITIPSVMEFTFLRKDRIKNKSKILKIPHPLDMPCTKKRADFILPDEWWKN
jgi:hypothetical protein